MSRMLPSPAGARDGWWLHPFQMFQTNLREVDAALDVDAVLDRIVDFGADTWLINAGGIYSFYPTDLPFQTRNPYLAERPGGDLLGDAISAAHRRGIKVMARMDFSKISMRIACEHPEWCFTDVEGQWQVQNGLASTSPAGEYFQHRSFEVLDEVLDRYDVDGFFFNWFGFSEVDYTGHYRGVSQDEASRRAFAEFAAGQNLPTGPESEQYSLWCQWSAQVVRDLAARMHGHVKARRPDVALMLRQSTDLLFHEANNGIGREFWPSEVSESTSAIRSRYPDRAAVVNSVSFYDMPYRLAGEEPDRFAQYLIQAIGRGANPSTYIMGIPGHIPYPSMMSASSVTKFHAAHASVYDGLVPTAEIGVVRRQQMDSDPSRQVELTAEFRGVYASLQERHLPFDVVPEDGVAEMVAAGALQRYRLLVVPDLGRLRSDVVCALDEFVAGGGRVLMTGRSGLDGESPQLSDSPIARVVDVTTEPDLLKSSFVARGEITGTGQPAIAPVLGAHAVIEPADDALRRFAHLGTAPYGPPEKAYGNRPDGQPGALISASRRSAAITWTVGRTYYETGLGSSRRVLTDIIDELLPEPQVRAQLPESVEVTVQRGATGLVIHLINLSGRRRQNFGPALPIAGGRLLVRGGISASALVHGESCRGVDRGGMLEIELPAFLDFEVIVVVDKSDA